MSSILTEEDIRDILNILPAEVQQLQWFDLGIQLGIPYSQLKGFERSDHCMTDMIAHWISNADNPNWETLAASLEKIGRKAVASNIHKSLEAIDADKEIKIALEEIKDKKTSVSKNHMAAHQEVRQFYADLQESLESHSNGLKQELQKNSRKDKQKIEQLQKDLKLKIDESEQQKEKLERLQKKPMDVQVLTQIKDVKKSIDNIRHQLQEIQEDIDNFALAKTTVSITNVELNDASLFIDDLTSYLKLEEQTISKFSISESWDNIDEC